MKANISIYESVLRLFVGIVWAAIFGGWLTSWVGILAIYPLVTSMSGWCLVYQILGKYTNEENPYHGHEKQASVAVVKADKKDDYKMTA